MSKPSENAVILHDEVLDNPALAQRASVEGILSDQSHRFPRLELVENNCETYLRHHLSDERFMSLQEAAQDKEERYQVFAELLDSNCPTQMNALVDALEVYKDDDSLFDLMASFACRAMEADADNPESVEIRSKASNTVIFLKKTAPFHKGNPEILEVLVRIAQAVNTGPYLSMMNAKRKTVGFAKTVNFYEESPGMIRLACLKAAQDAGLIDEEVFLIKNIH